MKIAVAFLHKNNKLFVAKRADSKKFMPGVFELPGGHIEEGESIEDGLQRELLEEFGIMVEIDQLVGQFTYQDKKEQVVEYCYLAKLANDDPKLNSADHSASAWISEEEIDEYLAENIEENKLAKIGFKLLNIINKSF
jgi:8-oxo-dGTP diphosphatase